MEKVYQRECCDRNLGGSQGKGIRIEIRIYMFLNIFGPFFTVNLLWQIELLGIAWIMVFPNCFEFNSNCKRRAPGPRGPGRAPSHP